MMNLFKVLPEERRTTGLLLLHYVWVVAVTIAGKSVRDAYFLNRFDRSYLPLMAVAAAIAVAASVAIFTRLERNMRSRILVPLTSVVFAASLTLGNDATQCMEFGGTVRRDRPVSGKKAGVFQAKDAPAPERCPLP